MKVVFSEHVPDFRNYVFPYHVWGFPEEGEGVRTAYECGFLPVAYDLSRFYLVRGVRIALRGYTPNGRVRNTRRRCAHVSHELVERGEYRLTPAEREVAENYFATQEVNADYRRRRFFEMVDAPFCTHVLRFRDSGRGEPVGLVPLLVREGIVHYGIPVYDPAYRVTSIGNHMMGTALSVFAESGSDHCYLGSCYQPGDLYKTRFDGMQFFNGYTWSDNRDELHFFVNRRNETVDNHTLGSGEYLDEFSSSDVQLLGKRTELAITTGPAAPRLQGKPCV